MDQLRLDLQYAIRMLFRNKTWAVLAIVTLALGIGPLTALYSYFDRVFFAQLPVPDPDSVVVFRCFRSGYRFDSSKTAKRNGAAAAAKTFKGTWQLTKR